MLESNVFSRTATDDQQISARAYNFTMGIVLLWGFLCNWWIVTTVPFQLILEVPIWGFLIGYFVSCLLGIFLFNKSSNPVISFIGYNLVVIPFGLVIDVIVSPYNPLLVWKAVQVTGLVTAIMMIAGTAFPDFFKRISGALTLALIAMIAVELFSIFFLHIHPGWIDWAVAAIFCGYIGVDWGRANNIPKTYDNAVDSAAALYMDIINLFVRILQIMGRRN